MKPRAMALGLVIILSPCGFLGGFSLVVILARVVVYLEYGPFGSICLGLE